MIKAIVTFIVLFVVFFFGIFGVFILTDKQIENLLTLVGYSLVCSVITTTLLVAFVMVF